MFICIDEFSKTFEVEKTMIYDSQKALFETFSNCVIINFKMIFGIFIRSNSLSEKNAPGQIYKNEILKISLYIQNVSQIFI